MKKLPALFLCLATIVCAQEPSSEAASSCLLGHSASPAISVKQFATNDVLSQDDYESGYAAPYYFQVQGMDIGYAQKRKKPALIYGGRLYPLMRATPILNTKSKPAAFAPDLADWSQVTDGSDNYLCASFNFEGLGRSGSFQDVRGGYLLSLPPHGRRRLFFVVANTRLPAR